jgi:hypothetical protein
MQQETALREAVTGIVAAARAGSRAGIPDELLYDRWYVAALGTAITRTPVRRVLLDQPVVLYRTQDDLIRAQSA